MSPDANQRLADAHRRLAETKQALEASKVSASLKIGRASWGRASQPIAADQGASPSRCSAATRFLLSSSQSPWTGESLRRQGVPSAKAAQSFLMQFDGCNVGHQP